MYGSVLERLMYGGTGAVSEGMEGFDDVQPNVEFEAMLNESGVPVGTIIETTCADAQSDILLALETYELHLCLGAAQCVAESAGASTASVVMEGAIKDFFANIGRKIHELWEKVKAFFRRLWDKITKKSKDEKVKEAEKIVESPEFNEKVEELKKEATSGSGEKAEVAKKKLGVAEGQSPMYKLNIEAGSKFVMQIVDTAEKTVDENMKLLDVGQLKKEISGAGTGVSIDKSTHNEEFRRTEDQRMQTAEHEAQGITAKFYQDLGKVYHGKVTSQADLMAAIDKEYGIGDKSKLVSTQNLLTNKDCQNVIKEIGAGKHMKELHKKKEAFDKHFAEMQKRLKSVEGMMSNVKLNDDADSDAKKGYSQMPKTISKMSGMIVAYTNIGLAVINRAVTIIESNGNAIMAYAHRIGGKKNVQESVVYDLGYGIFFEGTDADPEPVKDEESDGDDKTKDGEPATEGFGGSTTSDMIASFISSYM